MFTYNCLSIDSAIPIQEIHDYFSEIGATQLHESLFTYQDLKIKIIPSICTNISGISIARHKITVTSGRRSDAENFLTNFRLRFLSAGG